VRKNLKAFGICFGIAVALVAIYVFWSANKTMRNAYATWWAADMVVAHLQKNRDQWPKSWSDLRDDYEECVQTSGEPWTFDEIRNRVYIDFSATTDQLKRSANASGPEFDVIHAADGSNAHWQSREPNTIIFNYLHGVEAPKPIRVGFGGSGR